MSLCSIGNRSGCFGYGGDFGDVPNSKQFCINGILGPNREPHPIAFEAAALQCPVVFSLHVEGEVGCDGSGIDICTVSRIWLSIKNRRSFSDLSDLVLHISLGCDNAPVDNEAYTVAINLADYSTVFPGAEQELDITFAWSDLLHGLSLRRDAILDNDRSGLPFKSMPTEAWLGLSACISPDFATQFTPALHEVCCVTLSHPLLLAGVRPSLSKGINDSIDELMISEGSTSRDSLSMNRSVLANGDVLVEWGNGNTALVGGECGRLLSWAVSGTELLSSPIDMCFWRAPTDNDM